LENLEYHLADLQIVKARRIEAQRPFAKDPIGAAVKKQHGLKGVAMMGMRYSTFP